MLNFTARNIRATIVRTMKALIILVPFVLVPASLAALFQVEDLTIPQAIFRALSELPLVAATAWLLMHQQNKQQEMTNHLIAHFSARSEIKDEMYQNTIERMLQTIENLAKK